MRKILGSLVALSLLCSPVWGQTPQASPGQVIGNETSAQRPAKATDLSPLLDRAFGAPSGQGSILNRGASLWSATRTPVLGLAGTAVGSLGFENATSGRATFTPVAGALGTANIAIPAASGTLAVSASAPLVLGATSGALTCPTCVTSSGGGAITGTAPIAVSAGGVVSINAPYGALTASLGGIVYSGSTNLAILAGTATANQHLASGASAAPAWTTATYPPTAAAGTVIAALTANTFTATPAPVLGTAGSVVGSIGFQNATSGTQTITPATGALGSGVSTLVAGTYNLVGDSLAQSLTNKTLTSSTNVLGGVTMTLGSDATGDLYYRSGGVLTRLAIGSATNVLTVAGGVPTWAATGSGGTVTSVVCAATTITTTGTCYSAGQVVGTATNDNATAGNFGEYQESILASGSAITTTSGVAANITQITNLPAGDWDCGGNMVTNPAGTTVQSLALGWTSTTSATVPTAPNNGGEMSMSVSPPAGTGVILTVGPKRFSLASATTVFLSVFENHTISTMQVYGALRCRRMR